MLSLLNAMELNVTKDNVELAKTILNHQLQFCAALRKQIRLVEAQGASTPDGLKTSGKKAVDKAEKPAEKPVKAAKAPKKAAKKVAPEKKSTESAEKKAAAPKAEKKAAETTEDGGKKISLKKRVLSYVTKTYKSDEIWSPKILLSTEEFEGTSNVHLSQVLRALCGEGDDDKQINKVSRGKYQTL